MNSPKMFGPFKTGMFYSFNHFTVQTFCCHKSNINSLNLKSLMPHSLQKLQPRGWQWQKTLHLSLSRLPLCLLKQSPYIRAFFTSLLPHHIPPSPKWPISPTCTASHSYILFTNSSSSNVTKVS